MIGEGEGDPLSVLLAGLRALAPANVVVGARRIAERDETALLEGERGAVAAAGPLRRQEFASGRSLLRELIGRDVAIAIGDDRAPILPPDVRGSLAHDRHFVVAAISRDPGVISIGIDIEPVEALEARLAGVILRDDEHQLDAHLAFTLKEAAYKAWSTLRGRVLEHHDLRVSTAGGHFRAEVVTDNIVLEGAFGMAAGRWIALVVTEREQEPCR